MTEIPTGHTNHQPDEYSVADALIDNVRSEGRKKAALDEHAAITEAFQEGTLDPVVSGEAREREEYAIFFAEQQAKRAQELASNGGKPLTRTQRLTRFVFGHIAHK